MRIGTAQNHLTTALILSLTLAACGGSSENGKTQVVARVNGEEITVHQLNQVLGMMGPEAAANPADANKNALENIINQTIGVQAAVKMKLDRDPAIMQAIEFTKRRVLLDAYMERSLKQTAAPTPSEVHEYFSQHPELFANRHIYVFNQLTVRAGKESVSSLVNKVAGVNHMNEFVAWLKDKGVDYNLVSDVKPSEQLPMGMLAHMQKLKVGDLGYLSATDGVVVMEMLQAIEKPMTEQQSQPLIERYLANQKRMEAAKKMFEEMRANAKVEYLGEFKSDAKPEQAVPQAATKPAPVAPEKSQPPKADAEHIEKGVKGL
jgi:EpsD family peptidyl-prolyl cis-trans isomerase